MEQVPQVAQSQTHTIAHRAYRTPAMPPCGAVWQLRDSASRLRRARNLVAVQRKHDMPIAPLGGTYETATNARSEGCHAE